MTESDTARDGTPLLTPLLLDVAAQMSKALDTQLKQICGAGLAQYRVMRTLHAEPRISQLTIATILGQTEASISRQIKLLQQEHLLSVHRHPADKRERIVLLTPRGTAALEAMQDVLAQYEQTRATSVDYSALRRNLDQLAVTTMPRDD